MSHRRRPAFEVPDDTPTEVHEDHTRTTTDFKFLDEHLAISGEDVRKFVHYFKSTLRIGVELEKDNRHGRGSELTQRLEPTRDYNCLGRYGVYDVVSDGSLSHNGREVLVIGANEEFHAWHKRMKAIHEILSELGYHETPKCGMHYHMLCVQKEMVPEVVLKNLYNLVRYYADAFMWVASCQKGPGKNRGLSRWSSFSKMMTKSPAGKSVRQLAQNLGGRYVAFNIADRGYYAHRRGDVSMMQGSGGHLSSFHVEFRWPDASDSPAHIVALGNLFRALVLKAVELSEFGVVQVDANRQEWQSLKERVQRMSQGYPLTEMDQQIAIAKAKQLTKTVRNQLLSFDGSTVEVLEKISVTPPSVLRDNGRSWSKIESHYYPKSMRMTDANRELRTAIVRQVVVGCKRKRDWEKQMAQHLNVGSFETVRDRVDALRRKGMNLHWDKDIGTYLWLY